MKQNQHNGHEVMPLNEKLLKKGHEPSRFNEGILWCEDCQIEITPLN